MHIYAERRSICFALRTYVLPLESTLNENRFGSLSIFSLACDVLHQDGITAVDTTRGTDTALWAVPDDDVGRPSCAVCARCVGVDIMCSQCLQPQ